VPVLSLVCAPGGTEREDQAGEDRGQQEDDGGEQGRAARTVVSDRRRIALEDRGGGGRGHGLAPEVRSLRK
jgi:hypothetical protein